MEEVTAQSIFQFGNQIRLSKTVNTTRLLNDLKQFDDKWYQYNEFKYWIPRQGLCILNEDGVKTSQVHGIRAACKVVKSRYAKPFESVQVEIPYETGMSPYSGLVDLFEAKGMLKKEGNSLVYTTKDGEIIKQFRKAWERNEKDGLDIAMADISKHGEISISEITNTVEPDLEVTE